MSEQEWEDKLAEVQKHSEHWYNKYKELENKIADIKANCDLAIEGRDIKIKELELELTVEKDLHREETNLHLHAEEYTKSLEKETSILLSCKNCPENKGGYICEKEYNNKCLSQKIQYIKELEEENAELKADNDARKFAMVMSEKVEKQLREQLTKATEIIREIMKFDIPTLDYVKAEQFLKEIEK